MVMVGVGGGGGQRPQMGSHVVPEKCSGVEGAELSHLGAQEKTLALLMEGESRTMWQEAEKSGTASASPLWEETYHCLEERSGQGRPLFPKGQACRRGGPRGSRKGSRAQGQRL